MSVLQQGTLVIDSSYNATIDYCKNNAIPAEFDTTPAILLFMQSILGVGWWVFNMLIYKPNIAGLKSMTNADTLPLLWMWDNIGNIERGWTALAYLTGFLVHIFVSVVEFIAFMFYITGKTWWFGWYVNYPGMIGAIFLEALPPLFSIF